MKESTSYRDSIALAYNNHHLYSTHQKLHCLLALVCVIVSQLNCARFFSLERMESLLRYVIGILYRVALINPFFVQYGQYEKEIG